MTSIPVPNQLVKPKPEYKAPAPPDRRNTTPTQSPSLSNSGSLKVNAPQPPPRPLSSSTGSQIKEGVGNGKPAQNGRLGNSGEVKERSNKITTTAPDAVEYVDLDEEDYGEHNNSNNSNNTSLEEDSGNNADTKSVDEPKEPIPKFDAFTDDLSYIWNDEKKAHYLWSSILGEKFTTDIYSTLSPILLGTIKALENENSLKREGIFRSPGLKTEAQALSQFFKNAQKEYPYDSLAASKRVDLSHTDTYTICSLFVLHIQENELFVPSEQIEEWIEASQNENEMGKLAAILGLVDALPPANHVHLFLLVRFLRKLIKYAEWSKMVLSNIKMVFMPLLFPQLLTFKHLGTLFEAMMNHFQDLFPVSEPTPFKGRIRDYYALGRKHRFASISESPLDDTTQSTGMFRSRSNKRRSRSDRELRGKLMVRAKLFHAGRHFDLADVNEFKKEAGVPTKTKTSSTSMRDLNNKKSLDSSDETKQTKEEPPQATNLEANISSSSVGNREKLSMIGEKWTATDVKDKKKVIVNWDSVQKLKTGPAPTRPVRRHTGPQEDTGTVVSVLSTSGEGQSSSCSLNKEESLKRSPGWDMGESSEATEPVLRSDTTVNQNVDNSNSSNNNNANRPPSLSRGKPPLVSAPSLTRVKKTTNLYQSRTIHGQNYTPPH